MDEAENCDRIAIIDHGQIVAIDTPEELKASIGKDRVQISTADDQAAIRALDEVFGLEAGLRENLVTFSVESGEHFVPELFARLPVAIRSVASPGPLSTTCSCRIPVSRSVMPRQRSATATGPSRRGSAGGSTSGDEEYRDESGA